MSETIKQASVLAPGALTTVQDAGRQGYASLGWPECGAADKYSMRLANLLAGNGAHGRAAVLECTLMGPTLRFDCFAVLAITGAAFTPALDGRPAPLFTPFTVQAGQTLTLGTSQSGLRGYIAVYGGWDVPPVMGSRSTDVKCHVGGLAGRALQKGDVLPLAATAADTAARWQTLRGKIWKNEWAPLAAPLARWRVQGGKRWPVLRAVKGPQDEAFTAQGQEDFVRSVYTLSADCNRMACKLRGTPVQSINGSDILSDGIVEGSVQIASDGSPIVMLADHQTTGGYAKIATVIPTDVAVLAQLRPGEHVGFCYVSPEFAVQVARDEAARLKWLEEWFL